MYLVIAMSYINFELTKTKMKYMYNEIYVLGDCNVNT